MTDEVVPDSPLTNERWNDAMADGELLGQECEQCGFVTAAPKAACPECGGRRLETVDLPDDGIVISETTIHVPPEGFPDEYQVAVIDLGDARITARIEGSVEIGEAVSLTGSENREGNATPIFT
jgi:uncharacterized OB-fold protein